LFTFLSLSGSSFYSTTEKENYQWLLNPYKKIKTQILQSIAALRSIVSLKVVERVTMLLLYRWQRFFFASLVLIWGGIVLPSLIPSQAKAEPDQPGQTNAELTGKELASSYRQ
jgi:hypothetical protein